MLVKLKDVCTKIGSGATPRGGKTAYKEQGISLIRSQNVLDYVFTHEGLAYIDEVQASRLNNVTIKSDDVLLNITGDSVARCCIVDNSILPARINQHVCIVRADKGKILSSYILYFLQMKKSELLRLASSGATRNALTKGMIENLEVDLPSLNEQKKIVSLLDCIESKIRCNVRINRNLSEQAFTLFDKMYVSHNPNDIGNLSELADINPKRTLVKNAKARCIDMAKLSTSGAFPDGWEYKPYTGGMKFVNGDTLLARITPCLENGKAAYVNFLDENETAFGSTEYIVMASKCSVPSEMLYCLARYPKFVDYAVKNMNGSSGRQRVSGEIIGQYQIPQFSETELKEFGEAVKDFFEVMKFNLFENLRLIELRDSLLPRLMSGELDVSNIEI